ncbi:hypothetical protein RCL1_000412 [Eukaryota sp. TZLM3-RCL]
MIDEDFYEVRLTELLKFYTSHSINGLSRTRTPIVLSTLSAVRALFLQDYVLDTIRNSDYCKSYPLDLFLCKRALIIDNQDNRVVEHSNIDIQALHQVLHSASSARARRRFPFPFLSIGPIHLLRSATVSVPMETIGRNILSKFSSKSSDKSISSLDARASDVVLMSRFFSVKYVIDVMVEENKRKYLLTVSSSEKSTQNFQLYSQFSILQMPFPGVELFANYSKLNYDLSELTFGDALHPSQLEPKINHVLPQYSGLLINFDRFDIITLTCRYFQVIIDLLAKSIVAAILSNGQDISSLNVHCISGYDRTPTFAALLRVLLWADGFAHHSLSPSQVAFLIVSYDYFLFGHLLYERFIKKEEIMRFCFDIMVFLCNPTFRLSKRIKLLLKNKPIPETTNHGANELKFLFNFSCDSVTDEDFGSKLFEVRKIFLRIYDSKPS